MYSDTIWDVTPMITTSDRSRPRPTTTMAMPTARMPSTEELRAASSRLPVVKKPSSAAENPAIRTRTTPATMYPWSKDDSRPRMRSPKVLAGAGAVAGASGVAVATHTPWVIDRSVHIDRSVQTCQVYVPFPNPRAATRVAPRKGGRMGTMTGKVALVTGAASGIGRATAARLAAEDARVLL